MNLHFRPQGPASCLDDRRSKRHRHLHRNLGPVVPLRRLLDERYRLGTFVTQFRHHDSQLLFQRLGHQASMAPRVKRLPAEQDGTGTEVLGNLLRVRRFELPNVPATASNSDSPSAAC